MHACMHAAVVHSFLLFFMPLVLTVKTKSASFQVSEVHRVSPWGRLMLCC